MKQRHHKLLNDEKIAAWYKDQGAESTARNYLRMIGLFAERTQTTPKALLKLSAERIVKLFRGYAATQKDELGARPATQVVRKALMSWLNFNFRTNEALAVKTAAKVRGSHIARREYTALPTQEKLLRAFEAASPKVRAEMGLVAFSGVRLEVLGMREADDGLRFSDIPEASFDANGKLDFERVPCRINVRKELSKIRKAYYTFLGPEGCEYLRAYVALRVKSGEKVTKQSAVIAPDTSRRIGQSANGKRNEFVHPNNLGDGIRHVLRAVKIDSRPYDLRHYASQNMELAARDGLNVDYKEFWLGHAPKIKQLYSIRDAEQLVEVMREQYALTLRYIETSGREEYHKAVASQTDMLRAVLALSGQFSEERLNRMSEQEVVQAGTVLMKAIRAKGEEPSEPTTRIVDEAGLEALVEKGWSVKAVLPSGKIVVERGAQ